MEPQLQQIRTEADLEIAAAGDEAALEAVRVKYLGRSGALTALSEGMRTVSKEDKPRIGKLLNETRTGITSALDERKNALVADAEARAFADFDISLPATTTPLGTLHPITQLEERAVGILRRMGFSLADGPDIETEWHNFDALNTPIDHPARNEQDTFYLPDGRLLRSQTSPVQIRTMVAAPPPVRIIAPGGCYRRDEIDATHLSQFTQMEGLYVDQGVTLGDLKGTLDLFVRELFGPEVKVRWRPHFFPFTEPSFELDILVTAGGKSRWLEMAGCGMVDPAVFEAVNKARGDQAYDPEQVTGFAFGFGLDRLAMNMAAVPDIRLFIESDQRFLRQFR
ncbi:MAG TPA: phenylalanine--tRNA ligase subunit alpha [Chthoniobacteraceae bacterium]